MPLPSPEENRGQLQPMRKESTSMPARRAHRTRWASILSESSSAPFIATMPRGATRFSGLK